MAHSEIFKRLDRHEEEIKKLWESVEKFRQDFLLFIGEQEKRWEENSRRWEENWRRWEENNKRWEEAFKRFKVIEKTLLEHSEILRGYAKRLEEYSRRLGEISIILGEYGRSIEKLSRDISELKIAVGSIGRRMSKDLEKSILELYRHVLRELGIEVEEIKRFEYIDREGRFFEKGTRIEVDVVISDRVLYLIEVKSHAEVDDVDWFYSKTRVIEKILEKRADKLVIVAVNIDRDAYERAKELGIEVVCGNVVD